MKKRKFQVHKADSTIQRNLRELRNLIETSKDPVVVRVAYAMEQAIRWAVEDTRGWGNMKDEAILEAELLKSEI